MSDFSLNNLFLQFVITTEDILKTLSFFVHILKIFKPTYLIFVHKQLKNAYKNAHRIKIPTYVLNSSFRIIFSK